MELSPFSDKKLWGQKHQNTHAYVAPESQNWKWTQGLTTTATDVSLSSVACCLQIQSAFDGFDVEQDGSMNYYGCRVYTTLSGKWASVSFTMKVWENTRWQSQLLSEFLKDKIKQTESRGSKLKSTSSIHSILIGLIT